MSKKMSWIDYYINHCWFTGWQTMRGSFRIWCDLMCGNYQPYVLMFYDDPYEECVNWFWSQLGEDETLPKEFLEHLMQLADDVLTGKEKVIPLDEDFFDRMKDLVDGMEEKDG